jgi:hypothetical protein
LFKTLREAGLAGALAADVFAEEVLLTLFFSLVDFAVAAAFGVVMGGRGGGGCIPGSTAFVIGGAA